MRPTKLVTLVLLALVFISSSALAAMAKEEGRNWLLLRGPGLDVRVGGQRSVDLFYGLSGLGRGRGALFPKKEPPAVGLHYEIRYFIAVEDKPISLQRLDVYPFAAGGV